ncbi:hypothetical protein P9112_010689 [Eukaryota sp. TZLM1-RC]
MKSLLLVLITLSIAYVSATNLDCHCGIDLVGSTTVKPGVPSTLSIRLGCITRHVGEFSAVLVFPDCIKIHHVSFDYHISKRSDGSTEVIIEGTKVSKTMVDIQITYSVECFIKHLTVLDPRSKVCIPCKEFSLDRFNVDVQFTKEPVAECPPPSTPPSDCPSCRPCPWKPRPPHCPPPHWDWPKCPGCEPTPPPECPDCRPCPWKPRPPHCPPPHWDWPKCPGCPKEPETPEPTDPKYEVVNFDIKPGSCPNPFNCKSRGVIPTAILDIGDLTIHKLELFVLDPSMAGHKTKDLLDAEPGRKEEDKVVLTPQRSSTEFIGVEIFDLDKHDYFGVDEKQCTSRRVKKDHGRKDLVMHFDTQAVCKAICHYVEKIDRDDIIVFQIRVNDGEFRGLDQMVARQPYVCPIDSSKPDKPGKGH